MTISRLVQLPMSTFEKFELNHIVNDQNEMSMQQKNPKFNTFEMVMIQSYEIFI